MSMHSRLCLALAAIGLVPAPTLPRDSHAASPPVHRTDECVKVTSKVSLLHLGSLDSFDITRNGTDAAVKILDCIERGDPESARDALEVYKRLIPVENFGGEYTALQWLCEYLIASPQKKNEIIADKFAASYFHVLADNNYAVLKEYLKRKYHLDGTKTRRDDEAALRFRFYEDIILFNNPRRERWEKTGLILRAIGFKPGEVVADIGCGPGYYTFKIADLVRETGRVFAIDNNDRHLEYLSGLIKAYDARNVRIVRPSFGNTSLPDDAMIDHAFMCSLYYVLYASMAEGERAAFIGSIRRHLKPDGTLVVVENAMVEDPRLPYHGHYIAKELVIQQLKHYGFTLIATHQFIPQRYVLVFRPSRAEPESRGSQAVCDGKDCIPIHSSLSLAQFNKPGLTPGYTFAGRRAARLFYRARSARQGRRACGHRDVPGLDPQGTIRRRVYRLRLVLRVSPGLSRGEEAPPLRPVRRRVLPVPRRR